MNNLDKLFYWRGIASEYYNYRGEQVSVSLENRLRLLQAMGVNTESQEIIDSQAYALDIEPWKNWFPSFLMTDAGVGAKFEINLTPDNLEKPFGFEIVLEDGGLLKGSFIPKESPEVGDYIYEGVRYSRRSVMVQNLPAGYHLLKVSPIQMPESSQQTTLAAVPSQAYTPDWVTQGKRPWGIIVQLYTLRSARNWGIGDFSDLKLLITEASAVGIDMIGLNPLHALCYPIEHHCSPYSPSDRRFINPLYIDPDVVPEFDRTNQELLTVLVRLRAQEKVAYEAVFRTKMAKFREMYAIFIARELENNSERARQFLTFVEIGGATLKDFCLYEVLIETTGQHLDQLNADERKNARTRYAELIRFHEYLQWLANDQLESCQRLAINCGMKIGLMRDLAVGADGGGSEVTTNLELFCRSASVGAPPDPLAEKGQNWGLPPMDPATLRLTEFKHFIHLLRTNMAHCGALRIDHAMALMRLWWCPPGKTADFGAYVQYPFREMLGLLKLESVRNQCLVIGEDLGVVPGEFRQAMLAANIFTNKLFYFEKQQDGNFREPTQYEPHSLAMLTNHDVPTITSWWGASDLRLRERLNLLADGVNYESVLASRAHEKLLLLEWLARLGLIKSEQFEKLLAEPMSQPLAAAILHGASQCTSQLFVVQLEDLELIDAPINVPGTSDQYPNWQRKLAVPLEMLFAEKRVQSLLYAIAMERG